MGGVLNLYQLHHMKKENSAEIYIDDNEKVMNVAFPIEPKQKM